MPWARWYAHRVQNGHCAGTCHCICYGPAPTSRCLQSDLCLVCLDSTSEDKDLEYEGQGGADQSCTCDWSQESGEWCHEVECRREVKWCEDKGATLGTGAASQSGAAEMQLIASTSWACLETMPRVAVPEASPDQPRTVAPSWHLSPLRPRRCPATQCPPPPGPESTSTRLDCPPCGAEVNGVISWAVGAGCSYPGRTPVALSKVAVLSARNQPLSCLQYHFCGTGEWEQCRTTFCRPRVSMPSVLPWHRFPYGAQSAPHGGARLRILL